MKNDYTVLREIELKPKHKPTGFTRHFAGGQVANDRIAALKIMRYSDDAGFYLLYFDKEGNELTDTYHDTLQAAMNQAGDEFGIEPSDWEVISE